MINLDDKQSEGTHWVPSFIDIHTAVYIYSFEIKCIPQDVVRKSN